MELSGSRLYQANWLRVQSNFPCFQVFPWNATCQIDSCYCKALFKIDFNREKISEMNKKRLQSKSSTTVELTYSSLYFCQQTSGP